jgi:uroporphyrinogen decarboxylase
MRQAGRYLPEYKATASAPAAFSALCKNPDYACEVTLQPLARFPLDAAILFSDILTVPDAMGLGLYFAEGEGPRFERPVRDEAAIRALAVPDPNAAALRDGRGAFDPPALAGRVPLIGFSGSPYTLACYMVEGGGSDDFRNVKRMLYGRPDLLHHMLEVTARGGRSPT